jgi:D-alanyl-D-alanine carboxypeptidase
MARISSEWVPCQNGGVDPNLDRTQMELPTGTRLGRVMAFGRQRLAALRMRGPRRSAVGLTAVALLVGMATGGATASPNGWSGGDGSARPSIVVAGRASASASSPSPSAVPAATSTASPAASPAMQPSLSPLPAADAVPPVTNSVALPKCTYADVVTPLPGLDDWRLTLLDPTYSLPAWYRPTDLVSAGPAGLPRGFQVRAFVLPDLQALMSAARAAGAPLGAISTYRDFEDQAATFRYWVGTLGSSTALLSSARAGHSEHELGLVIDFKEAGGPKPWAYFDFSRDTKAGAWLRANAWRYGFVMSYPLAGTVSRTCYGYEPWHYRYVGRPEAAAVRSSKLTLREWLWLHQPDQTPAPPPTPFVRW